MKTALLIPAYEPDDKLLALLEQFRDNREFLAIVVDDGSIRDEAKKVFAQLPDFCIHLVHEVNRGKGAALKTGIHYILDNLPDCDSVLTADADGQHTYSDICAVNAMLKKHPNALVLGSRAFEGDVPLRSRTGNAITRQVYACASGACVYDTQTGLRAFGREGMKRFVQTPGDRYEYEINVLLEAAQYGIPILEKKIATVYLEDNKSSHFNTLRDSAKIYKCILRFASPRLLSVLIDFVLFFVLAALTGGMGFPASLILSACVARIIAVAAAVAMKPSLAAKSGKKSDAAAFVGKAVVWLALAAFGICLLAKAGWALFPAKLVTELVLFVLRLALEGHIVTKSRCFATDR